MRVIQGRFAEAQVYLVYVTAIFRPGVEVPIFAPPREFTGSIHLLDDNDLKIVIEEGRRQLDRQLADLERNRTRAGTLLTLGLAEVAVLSASARRVFGHGPILTCLWAAGTLLAVLAVGGGASLLTSQARFGRLDTNALASGRRPVLRDAALGYAKSTDLGEETIRTRVTVLRNGVLLAVLAAVLYATVWPFAAGADSPAKKPSTSPSNGVVTSCQSTCTPSSPSPLPAAGVSTSQPTIGQNLSHNPRVQVPSSPHP